MFEKIITYFEENPLYFWIAVAIVALIVICIIAAIVSHCVKKSKAGGEEEYKEEADETAPGVQTPAEDSAANETPAADEAPVAEQTEPAEPISAAEQEEPAEPVSEEPAQAPAAEQSAMSETVSEAPETTDNAPAQAIAEAPAAEGKAKPAAKKYRSDDEDDKRYAGKWVILQKSDGAYYFELRASNGEKLLSSIDYTTVSGARNGIKTHKNNILKNNIIISQNKKKQYFFRLLSGSKQLLCTGETYPTRSGCENAVDSVRRFAETALIVVQKNSEADESAGEN